MVLPIHHYHECVLKRRDWNVVFKKHVHLEIKHKQNKKPIAISVGFL